MKNAYKILSQTILPQSLCYLFFVLLGLIFGFQASAQTDAGIVEILFPQEGFNCQGGSTITPEFVLGNNGNTNINLLSYTATLDGIEIVAGTFNDIPVGAETTITLDPINVDPGQHSITFEIGDVNGSPDVNPNNNIQTVDFERAPGLGIVLDLLTDNYGQEVSFEIVNENGETIVSIEEETYESTTQYNEVYCLGEGCFTFTIYDSASDGICCNFGNGAYSLVNFYGQVISTGGDYQTQESTDFCLETLTEFLNYDISLSTEGNPTSTCTIYEPVLSFTNFGLEEVNSLTIEYNLEGEAVQTFEWTGNAQQFTIETIALPPYLNLLPDNYNLSINIVSINGEMDENPENNEGNTFFEIIDGDSFNIFIQANSPAGMEYSLENNENGIISNSFLINGATELDFQCLPIGCYTFLIESFSENGNVDITIENSIGVTLAETNGPIENQISLEFCTFPFDLPQLDGGITAILEPANILCNTEISPKFEVFNYGLETITEIAFEYVYDDSLTIEDTWMGTLTTYDQLSINLPSLENFKIGDHSISIDILSINGQTDSETDNNSLSQPFTISNAESYTLNFTADIAPQDNSYQIADSNGTILFAGEQGTFNNPFGTDKEDLCIYPGCYTLTIFDEAGNGGPNVSITNSDDAILIDGAIEGPELVLDFCIEGPEEIIEEVEVIEGLNDLPESAKIELFPNPSTRMFYLDHQLEGAYQISVQDLLGKTVFSQSLSIGQNTIDLGDATNGVYLLSIENKTERGVYKITLVK